MLILRLYLHTYLAMVKKTTFNNSDDWEDAPAQKGQQIYPPHMYYK